MICASCKATLNDGAKFCPECGAKVEKKMFCSNCGIELKPGIKFCPDCGTKIGDASEMVVKNTQPMPVDEKSEEELQAELFEIEKKRAAGIDLSKEEDARYCELVFADDLDDSVFLTKEQESEVLKIKIRSKNWSRLQNEWKKFDENSSASELEEGVKNDNAAAKYFLSLLYRQKISDASEAQEIALAKSIVPIVGRKAKEEAEELGKKCEEYSDREISLLIESAKDFYPPSCCWLSNVSRRGYEDEAFWYAKHAAEYGSVVGLALLGDCYYNGIGVDKDISFAEEIIKIGTSTGVLDEHNFELFYSPNPNKLLAGDDNEYKFAKVDYWKSKGYFSKYL